MSLLTYLLYKKYGAIVYRPTAVDKPSYGSHGESAILGADCCLFGLRVGGRLGN